MGESAFRLSLVVPMYNEAETARQFFARVVPVVMTVTPQFEIICVNDGSTDATGELVTALSRSEPRIKLLNLTRNFGKEAALTAGLDYASGDAVIPMDADLQDPPELIPQMVDRWREGYDMVVAVRADRRSDTIVKSTTASAFYRIARRFTDVPIPAQAGDFRLLDRAVVEVLRKFPERSRFMRGIFAWVGFRQTTVTYSRSRRAGGESKWRYWRLWNYALDGIFSFTTAPLRIWTYLGFGLAAIAACYMLFIIARTVMFGVDVPGYASLLVTVLFFSGLNMVGLGILGEYVGRIFLEVKRRPLYLVRSTVGLGEHAAARGHSADAAALSPGGDAEHR
jgi:glycosyltransferase involved in cell wall biosynthesis